jgi:hypothetical protein
MSTRSQPIFNPSADGLFIPVPFFREFHSRLFTVKPFRLKIAETSISNTIIQIHLFSAKQASVSKPLKQKDVS